LGFIHQVGVELRAVERSMAEERLYPFQPHPALQQVRGNRVTTASAVRYKNVRCKPMKRFPFLITFTIDDISHAVNILRVFNTYQEPLH
jgi:hypothetical protein